MGRQERYLPSRSGGPGFIVIRYHVEFTLKRPYFDESYAAWAKVVAKKVNGSIITSLIPLDRKEAIALIREYNLKEAVRTEDGVVYDTEAKNFIRDWKEIIDIHATI